MIQRNWTLSMVWSRLFNQWNDFSQEPRGDELLFIEASSQAWKYWIRHHPQFQRVNRSALATLIGKAPLLQMSNDRSSSQRPERSEKFFEYLKYNLNRHLHSNRAPFLMAFDSYWINEPYTAWRLEGLKLFKDHTLRHHPKDVYFVRLIGIIHWMKEPVGLERMKRGHLANIAHRIGCQEQLDVQVKQQCFEGEEIDPKRYEEKERSLLMIFDAVAEPLFRSNIVFYTTLSFLLLIVMTLIYDRIFKSWFSSKEKNDYCIRRKRIFFAAWWACGSIFV